MPVTAVKAILCAGDVLGKIHSRIIAKQNLEKMTSLFSHLKKSFTVISKNLVPFFSRLCDGCVYPVCGCKTVVGFCFFENLRVGGCV